MVKFITLKSLMVLEMFSAPAEGIWKIKMSFDIQNDIHADQNVPVAHF